MKKISLLVLVVIISLPSLNWAAENKVSMKEMANALCDIAAADSDTARKICQNEGARIVDKNLYDIALELCLNNATSTRNVVQCFADASEKIDILGPPYEADFSEKIYACENLEHIEQATQNEVVACQRKHFESQITKINNTKKSSIKNSAPSKSSTSSKKDVNKRKSKSAI